MDKGVLDIYMYQGVLDIYMYQGGLDIYMYKGELDIYIYMGGWAVQSHLVNFITMVQKVQSKKGSSEHLTSKEPISRS